MGDEPYKTQHESKRKGFSTTSTSQHQAAYASQRAEVLFGCYRRGDANNPERYVAAIAAVLSLYDVDLIREVTDPRTGIMTSEKYMSFMPNAGELKVYCDGVAARKQHLKWLGATPRQNVELIEPPPPEPGDLAQVFVPEGHARYSSLVDWTTVADARLWKFGKSSDGRSGLWIAWSIWEYRPPLLRVQAAE